MAIFHVEPKRVPKAKSPLFLVGLGGTGNDALLHIMHKFKHRFILPTDPVSGEMLDVPERTAYLGVDVDRAITTFCKDDVKFNIGNTFILNVQDMENKVNTPGLMNNYVASWWDDRISGFKAGRGAGGIRQVGRFTLFENADALVNKFKTMIQALMEVQGAEASGDLDIILTTGVSGGTGSGTFLDTAYLLRYTLKTYFPLVKYSIMAYVILPPVNVERIPNCTTAKQSLLETTGFAALKELDFWMNYDKHKMNYVQQYSENIRWKWEQPFNDVVLLDNSREDGSVIVNAYDTTMDILSESVLNFFSDEQRGADDPISFHSHRVNVNAEVDHMVQRFPVNYTYMSVGAASSKAQQDNMIVYEGKLVFDDVCALKENKPLLGTRKADQFVEAVLPPEQNYYEDFSQVVPTPGMFTDTVNWPNRAVMEAVGNDAFHNEPYQTFAYDTNMTAKEFAETKIAELYDRFAAAVTQYVMDPEIGPFRVLEYLGSPENGFLTTMGTFVSYWQSQADETNRETGALLSTIQNNLFPHMTRGGLVQAGLHAAGNWGDVEQYKNACISLFETKRDHLVATHILAEMTRINKVITNYVKVVLPFFCDLLTNTQRELADQVDDLTTRNTGAGAADLFNFAELRKLVDARMQTLEGAAKSKLMNDILEALCAGTFAVKLDSVGTIDGQDAVRRTFLQQVDKFVNRLVESINGIDMDDLIRLSMPGASDHEQEEYVAEKLMPSLKTAALTMMNLLSNNDGFVRYAYVSVPRNAQRIAGGLNLYRQTENITPKYSSVVDRIYWLNTYNCLPLYRYARLGQLEKTYDTALAEKEAKGVHLVYKYSANARSIEKDWSRLPSPVPHKLLVRPYPAGVMGQQEELADTLRIALESGAATLTKNGTREVLSVRLRRDGDAVETVEHFKAAVDAIVHDASATAEQKLHSLDELMAAGQPVCMTYNDYSSQFATAMGNLDIDVTAAGRTQAQKDAAAANLHRCRVAAAQYILYYQHPDVAEALGSQIEMYQYYQQVYAPIKAQVEAEMGIFTFCKPFMFLYATGAFEYGRTDITFTNVARQKASLFSKSQLSDQEFDLYDHCRPLVIMQLLFDEKDSRVDENDRRYLKDKAKQIEASVNDMDDESFNALIDGAKAFLKDYDNKDEEIRYLRGKLPQGVREKSAKLIRAMLDAANLIRRLG